MKKNFLTVGLLASIFLVAAECSAVGTRKSDDLESQVKEMLRKINEIEEKKEKIEVKIHEIGEKKRIKRKRNNENIRKLHEKFGGLEDQSFCFNNFGSYKEDRDKLRNLRKRYSDPSDAELRDIVDLEEKVKDFEYRANHPSIRRKFIFYIISWSRHLWKSLEETFLEDPMSIGDILKFSIEWDANEKRLRTGHEKRLRTGHEKKGYAIGGARLYALHNKKKLSGFLMNMIEEGMAKAKEEGNEKKVLQYRNVGSSLYIHYFGLDPEPFDEKMKEIEKEESQESDL